MLSKLPRVEHPDLIVGLDTHDDAGVLRLTPDLAIIQTVDFFTPIVDDPREYGRIAAANSLSDVYAMGGEPVTALNVVGFPASTLPYEILGEVLLGGCDTLQEAGVLLVGGHSVKSPELFYGLSVMGKVHPDRVKTNAGARAGDVLLLTKPIGTGVLTTALKKGTLEPEHLEKVTSTMRRLNRTASRLMVEHDAHACTDVTGFGLAGHLHEMILASGLAAEIWLDALPLLDGALSHAEGGEVPGGLGANRRHFGRWFDASAVGAEEAARVDLLFDPQTSGGLLISLPEARGHALLDALHAAGETEARIVGRLREGDPGIRAVPRSA